MIIALLIILLVISLAAFAATCIVVRLLLKKIDIYEGWIKIYEERILNVQIRIGNTLERMREIDSRGTFATRIGDKGNFECDDEVGVVFMDLLELLEELRKFVL